VRRSFAASSVVNSKLTVDDVKVKLANADAVCFDVDSTVIQEEGIDVLADFMGAGEAVAEWTRK
jgi:phosphoserine phosphatase